MPSSTHPKPVHQARAAGSSAMPFRAETRPDLSIEIQDCTGIPIAVMAWHPHEMHNRAILLASAPCLKEALVAMLEARNRDKLEMDRAVSMAISALSQSTPEAR